MRGTINKRGLLRQYAIVYALLVAALIFIFTGIFHFVFFRQAKIDIRQQAASIAAAIAQNIDFTGLSDLRYIDQEEDEVFRRIFEDLVLATRVQPNVSFIYTLRPKQDYVWEFVVDATLEIDENRNGIIDPEEARARLGEEYDVSGLPDLRQGWYEPSADREITSDEWGDWISGYAPVADQYGRTAAVLGVDISATHLLSRQKQVAWQTALALTVTFLVCLIIGFFGFRLVSAESKKIHAALSVKNQDLEKMVRKRTLALKQFIAVIVHEMRAPMTSVKWGLEALRQVPGQNQEDIKQLAQMENIVNNQIELISRLLDASRVGLQKLPIEKQAGDLSALAEEVVENFRAQAEQKNLKLIFHGDPRLKRATFDPKRLREVINNLISNAIKYTNKGSITVKVQARGQNKIRLSVADTGQGIPSKDHGKLFQPFMRLNKNREPGSGLGLIIAKGIIDAHRGKIGVQSQFRKGSTFWFEIPIK